MGNTYPSVNLGYSDVTISNGDTHYIFFVDTVGPGNPIGQPYQVVTLPDARAPVPVGKTILIVGNFTSAGDYFTIQAPTGNVIFRRDSQTVTTHVIGFSIALVSDGAGRWIEVFGN